MSMLQALIFLEILEHPKALKTVNMILFGLTQLSGRRYFTGVKGQFEVGLSSLA